MNIIETIARQRAITVEQAIADRDEAIDNFIRDNPETYEEMLARVFPPKTLEG